MIALSVIYSDLFYIFILVLVALSNAEVRVYREKVMVHSFTAQVYEFLLISYSKIKKIGSLLFQ